MNEFSQYSFIAGNKTIFILSTLCHPQNSEYFNNLQNPGLVLWLQLKVKSFAFRSIAIKLDFILISDYSKICGLFLLDNLAYNFFLENELNKRIIN